MRRRNILNLLHRVVKLTWRSPTCAYDGRLIDGQPHVYREKFFCTRQCAVNHERAQAAAATQIAAEKPQES